MGTEDPDPFLLGEGAPQPLLAVLDLGADVLAQLGHEVVLATPGEIGPHVLEIAFDDVHVASYRIRFRAALMSRHSPSSRSRSASPVREIR